MLWKINSQKKTIREKGKNKGTITEPEKVNNTALVSPCLPIIIPSLNRLNCPIKGIVDIKTRPSQRCHLPKTHFSFKNIGFK